MISNRSNDFDAQINRFLGGICDDAYTFLGSHPAVENGQEGYLFRTWAPRAAGVSVMGNFNNWNPDSHPMHHVRAGVWELFLPGMKRYDIYKYAVHTQDGRILAKADPYAYHAEMRPDTASKIYDIAGYEWGDSAWLNHR